MCSCVIINYLFKGERGCAEDVRQRPPRPRVERVRRGGAAKCRDGGGSGGAEGAGRLFSAVGRFHGNDIKNS